MYCILILFLEPKGSRRWCVANAAFILAWGRPWRQQRGEEEHNGEHGQKAPSDSSDLGDDKHAPIRAGKKEKQRGSSPKLMRLVKEEGEGVSATETLIFSQEFWRRNDEVTIDLKPPGLDNLDEEIEVVEVDL
jgi:hypothetical protein